MNGKRREIPVTPPERELQWCYYSPSIFLASSQTALPLSSFDTHARWQPVTQTCRSWWSYGKIENCEQSIKSLFWSISIFAGEQLRLAENYHGARYSLRPCQHNANSLPLKKAEVDDKGALPTQLLLFLNLLTAVPAKTGCITLHCVKKFQLSQSLE